MTWMSPSLFCVLKLRQHKNQGQIFSLDGVFAVLNICKKGERDGDGGQLDRELVLSVYLLKYSLIAREADTWPIFIGIYLLSPVLRALQVHVSLITNSTEARLVNDGVLIVQEDRGRR